MEEEDQDVGKYHQNTDMFKAPPPSSDSMQNAFRRGQVLKKRGEGNPAIATFLQVCDDLERVISMNPGADIDLQWISLALGEIADIYQERTDYDKSVAFRKCQHGFLYLMQQQRGIYNKKETDGDFEQITSFGVTCRGLFGDIRAAREIPDSETLDTPKDILKKYQDALEEEHNEEIEALIRRFEETAAQREANANRSFLGRNMDRINRNPYTVALVIFIVVIVTMTYYAFVPKVTIQVPEGEEAQWAMLQRLMAENQRKKGKQKQTAKPSPRPTSRYKVKNPFEPDL